VGLRSRGFIEIVHLVETFCLSLGDTVSEGTFLIIAVGMQINSALIESVRLLTTLTAQVGQMVPVDTT
jgi:hypothetical protein